MYHFGNPDKQQSAGEVPAAFTIAFVIAFAVAFAIVIIWFTIRKESLSLRCDPEPAQCPAAYLFERLATQRARLQEAEKMSNISAISIERLLGDPTSQLGRRASCQPNSEVIRSLLAASLADVRDIISQGGNHVDSLERRLRNCDMRDRRCVAQMEHDIANNAAYVDCACNSLQIIYPRLIRKIEILGRK